MPETPARIDPGARRRCASPSQAPSASTRIDTAASSDGTSPPTTATSARPVSTVSSPSRGVRKLENSRRFRIGRASAPVAGSGAGNESPRPGARLRQRVQKAPMYPPPLTVDR